MDCGRVARVISHRHGRIIAVYQPKKRLHLNASLRHTTLSHVVEVHSTLQKRWARTQHVCNNKWRDWVGHRSNSPLCRVINLIREIKMVSFWQRCRSFHIQWWSLFTRKDWKSNIAFALQQSAYFQLFWSHIAFTRSLTGKYTNKAGCR